MENFIKTVILSSILLSLLSCSNKTDKKTIKNHYLNLQTGKVYENIKIESDTSLSYAVYLPESYTKNRKTKVFLIFDPHADGVLPVRKYKTLADKYGVILAASNNSKNGMRPSYRNHVITEFIGDVEKHFNVDKDRLFTMGLSGGARIAALIGIFNNNVKGIIGCGGGFPNIQHFKNNSFTWIGIVGNKDFNFQELKNLYNQLILSKYRAYLLVFDGKHEWPPVDVVDEAFGILLKNKTEGLKYEVKNPNKLSKWDKKEMKQQNIIVSDFTEKDTAWWKNRIKYLDEKRTSSADKGERLMNARLYNYIGMVSYLFTSNAAKTHNLKKLEKYLTIYETVEPSNPDMFYYKAYYFALKKDKNKTLEFLKKAVDNGLNEKSKILREKVFSFIGKDNLKKLISEKQ